MEQAIEAVRERHISVREAARRFDVPRTTLQRRLSRLQNMEVVKDMKFKNEYANNEQMTTVFGTTAAAPAQSNLQYAGASNVHTSSLSSRKGRPPRSKSLVRYKAARHYNRKRRSSDFDGSHSFTYGSQPMRTEDDSDDDTIVELAMKENEYKGPRRAINCKIRLLATAAGTAIDELSNNMITQGKIIYKLGLGYSPFPIPQCVVDELRTNAYQRDYQPVAGLPALCEDIAKWATATLPCDYTSNDVLVGPGTKELLFVLQTVYYGDLLLPNPSCTSYAPQANIVGRNMMRLQTFVEDRWILRPEVLDELCSRDPAAPRILILNSPSNPTGCAYRSSELKALARVARKYRLLVISDEVYADLHHTGEHVSISRYYPEGTIVLGGLSKWCGAGGWRVGFWLFPPSMHWLKKSMLVMASETYTAVASPIQYAARRAFVLDCSELQTYRQKSRKILQIITLWCTNRLNHENIMTHLPDAGFYLFSCFGTHRRYLQREKAIFSDVQLCKCLLDETGVAILPGSAFGRSPEELYVRLALVDFKGELAMYLIETLDNDSQEAIDDFMQSVCPNVAIAIEKIIAWVSPTSSLMSN